jgi:hypothetical protein
LRHLQQRSPEFGTVFVSVEFVDKKGGGPKEIACLPSPQYLIVICLLFEHATEEFAISFGYLNT